MSAQIRVEDRECPLSTAMSYVGEWWTMLILHDCFDGYTRFDEFEANIGLSSSMLTKRLKVLVENGILTTRPYQDRPVRNEYVLTEFGRSLRPILVALAAWRNEQLAPEERAMVLVDVTTGDEVEPVTIDPVTGLSVSDPRFAFRSGPAAGPEMRARYATPRTPASTGRTADPGR
ncbi:helix-turn-helix domain-containing protein [Microbacterium sp. 5K110]|jgi:DNA-binding HxlR family transcriptional regulator|uniref:winged helix-turn-helix transcriptional regulator n=1 Tax=unclassified Microbacterium TaxID=2609290 RepID=UPI0010FDD39F|nr:helix-turn-helix domain-containing protein [Microbacterium sp. 5K110]TLF34396.1 helix-turn-helix transcriptional regulator [Microbacterium sp. 5K110]